MPLPRAAGSEITRIALSNQAVNVMIDSDAKQPPRSAVDIEGRRRRTTMAGMYIIQDSSPTISESSGQYIRILCYK